MKIAYIVADNITVTENGVSSHWNRNLYVCDNKEEASNFIEGYVDGVAKAFPDTFKNIDCDAFIEAAYAIGDYTHELSIQECETNSVGFIKFKEKVLDLWRKHGKSFMSGVKVGLAITVPVILLGSALSSRKSKELGKEIPFEKLPADMKYMFKDFDTSNMKFYTF